MAIENFKPTKKIISNESDFATTNMSMQDTIKLDNVSGKLQTKKKLDR